MKNYIVLPQPLADFVVSGVIDIVEAVPDVVFTGTVAVVSSHAPHVTLGYEEYELIAAIVNAVHFDNVAHDSTFPLGSVVGYVDIVESTAETYSMWQTKSGQYWRLAHPLAIANPVPFDGPELPFGSFDHDVVLPAGYVLEHHAMRVEPSGKLSFPVNASDFENLRDGQIQSFELFVDDDVVNSGIFVSPDSYETVGVDTVAFENDGRKLLFSVKEILSGVMVDDNGEEVILKSAFFPEGHLDERLSISLDKKLMWI